MSRYFIYLSYNGTRYCGWQNQPNGISVQCCLEEVISKVLRHDIRIVGAGRTDAGVHARMMVAHFDVPEVIENTAALVEKLNNMLPKDIAISKITPVTDDAHARFDACSRTYKYVLSEKKDTFNYEYVYRMSLKKMDFDAMNRACRVLFYYSDFTSFSKLHTDVKTNNCRIMQAEFVPHKEGWCFIIRADRFLRNMVRAVVGTLLEVGRGKMTLDEFRAVIEAKDRCKAGSSVPAQGLFLVEVEYPEAIFL